MSEVIAAVEDPWQARLNRMRRIMPLPLLLVSSAAALVVPFSGSPAWAHRYVGVPAAVAAAVLWVFITARFHGDASTRWRLPLFAVHSVLAGLLVWVNPAYGVFAYMGFLYCYGLGPRWRTPGFAVTALVVAAALCGGYPSGRAGQTVTYLMVAAVLTGLVMNSSGITVRMMEQNQDRGRMIGELAEAKQRLEASMAENAELHAQLLVQAREAGVVEERRRMAGEIHDTLAQGLTGIIAQLEAAEHTRNNPGEWSRHLDQARALARANLTEARRSVRALRPEQLEDATLPEAISTLARTWSEQSAVAAALDTTGTVVRAGADTEAAVFRVAQEALSNVAKHAHATKVQITLTYLDDTLLLDVADDGDGFDPASMTDGYGLLGMRQRLSRISGALTVESAPGYGTTINAAVPIGEPAPGAGR